MEPRGMLLTKLQIDFSKDNNYDNMFRAFHSAKK